MPPESPRGARLRGAATYYETHEIPQGDGLQPEHVISMLDVNVRRFRPFQTVEEKAIAVRR
jgi:hypothetical protein